MYVEYSRNFSLLRVAACPICVTAVWITEAAQLELVNVNIVKWAESILGHSSLMPSSLTIALGCSKFVMRLGQHCTSPNFTPPKSEPTYFLTGPATVYREFTMYHMLHTFYFAYILFCCSSSFTNRSFIIPTCREKATAHGGEVICSQQGGQAELRFKLEPVQLTNWCFEMLFCATTGVMNQPRNPRKVLTYHCT